MSFFVKLATTAACIVGTTASAYLLVDEKKRHGILFAATVTHSPNNSSNNINQTDQQCHSAPIRSREPWNWNWDGLVLKNEEFILFSFCFINLFLLVDILK